MITASMAKFPAQTILLHVGFFYTHMVCYDNQNREILAENTTILNGAL